MTAKNHGRLVGILLLAHGGLQALALAIVAIVYGAIGVAMLAGALGGDGKPEYFGVFFIVVVALLAIAAILFCGSQILGGYKLLMTRPGGRFWGVIGSIVAVLSFPIGTALGVYGLWVLFGDMGRQLSTGNEQLDQSYQRPNFDYQLRARPPTT